MKSGIASLLFFLPIFFSCAESPGELTPVLDVATLSPGSKAAIAEFVFAAQPASGGNFLFFPSDCIQNDYLVKTSCGFSATADANFKIVLPLGGAVSFPNGKELTLTACGLDPSHAVVASGSNAKVSNKVGTSPTIVMSDTVLTACQNILPP